MDESEINEEEEEAKLSRDEVIQLVQEQFNLVDEDKLGWIHVSQLRSLFERCEISFNTDHDYFKLVSDIDQENTGHVSYLDFLNTCLNLHNCNVDQEQVEKDTLEAYVAVGGDQDKGGYVNAEFLVDLVKNVFHLTIDIEGLIQEIDKDRSGKIEYEEFETLLTNDGKSSESETFKKWFSML